MSHLAAEKTFCQKIQYCRLCLLLVPYQCAKLMEYIWRADVRVLQASSEISEKFLMCIPRTKYARILPQFRITKSHFGTKRKEFCTISGKQTLRVDFLKTVLEILNSIWGKNAPCWSQKEFFVTL